MDIVKSETIKELISSAPNVLNDNKVRTAKAKSAAESLIEQAETNGMNDALDELLDKYISKAKATIKLMNENRTPFTQAMSMIAKEFTTLENELKETANHCQSLRDKFATEKMRLREEAERIAREKLAKVQDAIEIKKHIKIELERNVSQIRYEMKLKIQKDFNALTLDEIDNYKLLIYDNYDISDKDVVNIGYATKYHTIDEVSLMQDEVVEELLPVLSEQHNTAIEEYLEELERIYPSRRQQLENEYKERLERERIEKELKVANEEKRKELEEKQKAFKIAEELRKEEEQKRLEEEELELKKQAEEEQRKSEIDANSQATGESVAAYVDNQANLFNEEVKAKESYKIHVKNKAGYLQLAQFWFERVGKDLTSDKIEKMTFLRMQTFAEKYAIKNEEFLESPHIVYEPIYKAK